MATLTTVDGVPINFSPDAVTMLLDHDPASGKALTVVCGVTAGSLLINEPVDVFMTRINITAGMAKLTRGKGLPIWVSGKAAKAVRPPLPHEYAEWANAVISIGNMNPAVAENPDEVIRALDAHGGAFAPPPPARGLVFDPQPVKNPAPAGVVAKKPQHARSLGSANVPVDFVLGRTDWSPLANIAYGVCVIAAIGHVMQLAAWRVSGKRLDITDDAILTTHSALTGWKRTDPIPTMPGTNVGTALQYLCTHGLGNGAPIKSWYRSNWLPGDDAWHSSPRCLSKDMIVDRLSWFGGVILSLKLPQEALEMYHTNWPWPQNNHYVWRSADMSGAIAPGGGHAISLSGYDGNYFTCSTWDGIVQLDWDFIKRFTDEIYFVFAGEWIGYDGKTPEFGMSAQEAIDTMTAYSLMELFAVVPWP